MPRLPRPVPWFMAAISWIGVAQVIGCAAAPVHLECGEQRFRLENEDMSEDQRRFATDALRDCEQRLDSAKAVDSTRIENLNRSFTPGDSL